MEKVLLVEKSALHADELAGISVGLARLGILTSRFSCSDPLDSLILEEFSAVYFSGGLVAFSKECEEAAKSLCERCRGLEIPVVFDPDLNKIKQVNNELINEIAALSEIFLPSEEDAKSLCGLEDPEEIAEHYLKLGTRKIVVKLDKKGAYYKSAKENGYAPTFRADKVVDVHGAGNAFAAGLISGITEEVPLGEAVVRANACGCIAIQAEGELDCLPTMDRLREYMLSHRFAVDGCKDY